MSYIYIFFQRIDPARFFILCASFFGLTILFLTPPFQIPDEINHFYRAFQVSEGQFIAVKQNNRIGGLIPTGIVKITEPFLGLCWNPRIKTNHKIILDQLKTPINREERTFIDFPNTGMYSPVSYFPQAISIFVLSKFHLPPLFLFYGARVFSLFIWILSLFYAIKKVPFYKWFFVLLALLPMSMFINMSLSADVVSNLLSFVLIAYIMNLAYRQEKITTYNFIIVCLLAILLASAKLVYTPVILLFLLIPIAKFRNKWTYIIMIILLLGISLGSVLMWSSIMNNLYLPYSMYNARFRDGLPLPGCGDMHLQMQYILNHGFYLWHVFYNSMIHAFDMYFRGMIGTFGWLDTKLPLWLIYLSYAVLFLVALIDGNKNIIIKQMQKALIFLSLLIIICLVLLSQHLTWDCVGGDNIATIQGRYFIPALPLLFLLFYNSKFNYSGMVIPVVVIFSVISLSVTANTLYKRYYGTSVSDSYTIKCDAEKVTAENLYVTDIPEVLLENGNTQSGEKARSGKYSAKLMPEKQFGFTYHMYNCGSGDSIKVETWRSGLTGGIIVSAGGNVLFQGDPNPFDRDNKGWEHLQLNFRVPADMENREIGVCLFNNGTGSSYFDDLVISYNKTK